MVLLAIPLACHCSENQFILKKKSDSLQTNLSFLPKVPHPDYVNKVMYIEAYNTSGARLLSKYLQLLHLIVYTSIWKSSQMLERKRFSSFSSLFSPVVRAFLCQNREFLTELWTLFTRHMAMLSWILLWVFKHILHGLANSV